MTAFKEFESLAQPLPRRIRDGGRRGALVGAYIFGLIWLFSLLHKDESSRVIEQPITGLVAIVAGSAIAGGLLWALRPRLRNLAGALGLSILCLFPILLAIVTAFRGAAFANVLPALIGSIGLGAIWGTMAWRGWHR